MGAAAPNWKGGRLVHRGYVYIYASGHHLANRDGYVAEHRLVMEAKLGRPLQRGEVVHHINGIKNDNRPKNLIVMAHGAHSTMHAPKRVYNSARMAAAGRKGAEARWGKRA